jgi:hypothetical protein
MVKNSTMYQGGASDFDSRSRENNNRCPTPLMGGGHRPEGGAGGNEIMIEEIISPVWNLENGEEGGADGQGSEEEEQIFTFID